MKLSEIKKHNELTAVLVEMNGNKITKTESNNIYDLMNVLQELNVKATINYQGDNAIKIKDHLENTEWTKSELGFSCDEFLGIVPGKAKTKLWISKCVIVLMK